MRTNQTCYSCETGAAERVRCIMQGLLPTRRMPNPAPQPNNNLRQLPHAVGLERSSHVLTQPKMLKKFYTLHHENKGKLVHVHYPSKLSKHIYDTLTKKKKSTITNIKHKLLLPRSFIIGSRILLIAVMWCHILCWDVTVVLCRPASCVLFHCSACPVENTAVSKLHI